LDSCITKDYQGESIPWIPANTGPSNTESSILFSSAALSMAAEFSSETNKNILPVQIYPNANRLRFCAFSEPKMQG
jgi:heme O synthase-like polyprenyltransferase